MVQEQSLTKTETAIWVKPFQWEDWRGLWHLRNCQLVEEGITTDYDDIPEKPDLSSPYEQDYHRIDQVYLAARGNFWIAWMDDLPVGHIGAEDKGDYVELRRMYVRAEYRRRGIGTLLVQTLVDHCIEQKVGMIELWTAKDGPGRFLYEKCGFRQVEMADGELDGGADHNSEIRMRLALGGKVVDVFDWIEQELAPTRCNSETFFYDEMASQSGYCLPIIYQPFDAGHKAHWRDRGSLFDFLCSTEGEGKRLLDFGPGDGWPSLIVAPFAAEIVGVDGSRKRVEVCTTNAARLGIANARFVYVEPGSTLPFEDGSFDGVMAASSVEQAPDPQATLRELYRVLRTGGRLRISYEALSRYRGGAEREVSLHERDGDTCWLTLFDRHVGEEYARMVRLALVMDREDARRLFPGEARHPAFEDVTVSALQRLRPVTVEAQACTLKHPSGRTLVAWMREIGFREVQPTHDGAWFAGRLFDQLPVESRPASLSGVDAVLRPPVEVVVQMAAPVDTDPMITAVK